jgi:hypothetical protein
MNTTGSASNLPREVTVERTGEMLRVRLPRRRLGRVRLVGLVPVLFGLVFISIPLFMMSGVFREVWHKPDFFHALIALFLLVFVVVGLKPVNFGMQLLFGRTTVELGREWLRVVESAGPFRLVRKARREDIARFEITVGKPGAAPAFLQILNGLGSLEAQFAGAKPMQVALGYPREWLAALGDELRARINDDNIVRGGAALPAVGEVVKEFESESRDPMPATEIAVQPKQSNARLEIAGAMLTLTLPPLGLRRGRRGLFLFSLVWCAFMTVFTAVVLGGILKAGTAQAVPFLLFALLFWGIGIGMMLAAVNMARRRALLVADGGGLRVAQQGLFGRKSWAWSREQLAAIRADRSGMEVNNVPVIELQIHGADDRKTGLFSGREDAELQWMATVLRQHFAVPAQKGE